MPKMNSFEESDEITDSSPPNGEPHVSSAHAEETASRKQRLKEQERFIEQFHRASREAGEAFRKIRDNQLYAPQYSKFGEYCRSQWDYSERYANFLIQFAEICDLLEQKGIDRVPAHESQARELSGLHPKEQVRAWKSVLAKAEAKDTGITAKLVRGVVRKLTEKWRKEQDARRPEGFDKVFDDTDGTRIQLPSESIPEGLQEQGLEFFGDRILPPDALNELPPTDELISAIEEAGRSPMLPRDSRFSDVAPREWNLLTRDPQIARPVHFQDEQEGLVDEEAFMPTYNLTVLPAPASQRVPGSDEGPAGRHVHVAPEVDLFDPRLPERVIEDALHIMRECPQWRFFFATKHLDRLDVTFPENAWVGATARTKTEAEDAAQALSTVEGGARWLLADAKRDILSPPVPDYFDWIIVGALGEKRRAIKLTWNEALDLSEEAETAGCALYFAGGIDLAYRSHPAPAGE